MERHTRLSRAAVVLVAIALIAAIAAAVWFASPDAPYVPSEDSGAALGTAAPAEDGTVAGGYQPSSTSTGISDNGTDNSAITTIRNSKSGSYHLTTDIVVNSLTDCEFSGTLDGNGKTIYIRYDSEVTGEPEVDPEYVGIGALFGNLSGATIKNTKIVVETFRYVESSAGTRNVGIIAGDAWGGVTIENVYVALQYSPTSNGRAYFLDSGEHGSFWSGTTNVELNFGAVLGKSGASDSSPTDVTLKNVTVDNQTSGDYGFSAWVRHNEYCNYKVSMGHFVGWVTGELSMQNCTLRGGESAKMTIERGGSGGTTTNQSGAVIGRLDEQNGSSPSLTIDGLDMELAINFDDHAVMNNISGNNGIIYGNDANNSWTVNVKDIYWNQNSGDPGWYDGQGNDTITYSNLTKYDPNTIGVSFDKDGDKVLLSAKAQYVNDASSIVKQIVFNGNTYTVWDKLIATGADTVGQWTQVATVDAPNLSSGGNVTYTAMGAGTFTIEGGETITGVSGNSYTAEREYDGTVPQSPSVVLSDNGGSYADVWKTTNASANVGQYTMTFDKSVLTAAGSVVAAGSDGLTYIAKNGIVYSPESIDPVGRLNIANDINVTVTQAPVTVTPNVPDNDLYTGNRLPELTATAVDGGGSPVEGTIAWDDPNATLISGTHSYAWTWTPTSSNYQTETGSMELEAFDRKIESLSVQGDFKKAYTAYEPFDSTNVEVIAHYSDGSSEQLVNDEYEFTVVNGDKDRLIVGNNTVTVSLKKGSGASTTITITVSKLAVDVPIAIQGLAYNGAEQIGVAASADNYYSLSGDTGTNAAAYTATAELNDKVNTRWDTDTEDDTTPKEIGWSIAKKDVDITVEHTGKTYDGQKVEPTMLFTAHGVNNEELALTVTVDGGKTILNAGTYSVTASLAESVTNYTADPVMITYTVNKKGIQKPIDSVPPYTYNGTEQVVTIAENADYTVNGTTKETDAGNYSFTIALTDKANTEWEGGSSDDITVTWSIIPMTIAGTVSAPTDLTYDGNAKEATFKLTSGKLFNGDAVTIEYSGDNVNVSGGAITATAKLPVSGNYAWAGDTSPSATFTISPKAVEIESIQELTKTYDGQEVDPSSLFTAPNGVDGQPIELTITVDGGKAILGAGTYTVTAKPTSANYSGACEVKYIIQKASPSVTVKVDTDTTYYSSQSLYDIAIEAEEPSVAGNIAWEEGQVLSAATTEYSWVFTPDDVDNYEIVTGKVTLKVENVTLNRIEVTKNPDKMSYVAYSNFDATGMIVTAYFDGADARELSIEELTLSGNTNLQYGDGEATITITFQEKTATVTVNVTKMLIPVPKAQTGIVFDGVLHTGIVEDEQWSQYYHVDAESEERYAGTYTAVVNLNDVNNTAWEGTEDSEPKEIPWTIEHVTIEVTVNAESKTVEYGTAYSWDPYEFFAVEVTNSDLFEVKLDVFNDGSITDISTAKVGEYSEGIFASVTRKDGGALEEQDLASFKFSKDITQLAMKVIVTAKTVEVALDENVDFAVYDGEKLSEEELFGMFKMEMNREDLAFEVDGVPYDAAEIVNAGEYTVKVVSANDNYNLTGTTEGVYKIAKATLTVTASVESEGLDTSDDLYTVPLSVKGVGVNGEEVSGTGVWASGQSLSEGTNNYKFVFTPDQEFAVNYEVCEGECEIANVAQATLTGVFVEVKPSAYVAFDKFDRSSIVVEALYGEDRKQVTDYTLTFSIGAEDKLLAGTGITVAVTYTDGEVTQSTEFTIDVAKRAVAKPVVDTTVFDATGETITLPIAESEYYTIYGNTAIEPGRYVATVELNDPANTMWEDGSTDVVSIAWTISEPVTSDEVIADILAMEKVTWQNAEEFLDLEARYNALDESEQTAEATAKLETLKAQYDALRNAAFDDIEAAHEVTAKSLGRALAAAAAGLSAAAIALAIAKRRSI